MIRFIIFLIVMLLFASIMLLIPLIINWTYEIQDGKDITLFEFAKKTLGKYKLW